MNIIGFIVIDNGANEKDVAEGAIGLNHIVFIVIDDGANDKDAAAGEKLNEFVSSSSLKTKRTTKTPPQAQHG